MISLLGNYLHSLTNTADIPRVLTETLVRLAGPGWLADTFHGGAVGQAHLGWGT